MIHGTNRFIVNTAPYTGVWTAEACLKHLNDMGVHHFELTPHPGFLWPGDMDKMGCAHFRRFLAGHRLRIVSINTSAIDLDIAVASPESRAAALDLIERTIELGGDIGAQGIVIALGKADPRTPAPAEQLRTYLFAALDRLTRAAEQAGTGLWIENMPFAWQPTAAGMMQLLDGYGDDRIGVVYDVANGWFLKEDLGAALRAVAKRLRLVQLADTSQQLGRHDRVGHDRVGHDRVGHDRVGMGSVPFQTLPPLFAEIGYADWPVLEIIDGDPDSAIAASIDALLAAGFGNFVPKS